LVNSDLEILQFRGDTGPFLAPAPGKPSLNILKMLREGLLVALRAALLKAKKEEETVRTEGLRVKSNGGYRNVNVEVIPVKDNTGPASSFLILFEEPGSSLVLKELYRALMLFRFRAGIERPQVFSPAGFCISFPRIESILS
jgi:hypothetical protein